MANKYFLYEYKKLSGCGFESYCLHLQILVEKQTSCKVDYETTLEAAVRRYFSE